MISQELLALNAALSGEVQRSQEALKISAADGREAQGRGGVPAPHEVRRSSEQLAHAQLELVGSQVAPPAPTSGEPAPGTGDGEQAQVNVTPIEQGRSKRQAREHASSRDLPEHLPRRTVLHTPQGACNCQACGQGLRQIGQDVSEVLDYEPGSFHVVRHVRPRLACKRCSTITQAPAPSRPIDRCLAGTGLITHVLVSKYCDHTPLYRQCQIYGREGVPLQRSTLADWVAQAAAC